MRKTCLYYSQQELSLLESETARLKSLSAIYSELLIRCQIPQKFSPKQSYIRLTSSQTEPVIFSNLKCTIVYCLKLDQFKKQNIINLYRAKNQSSPYQRPLYITNQFSQVVIAIVKELGYQQPIKDNNSGTKSARDPENGRQKQILNKCQQNRFQKQKQFQKNAKNTAQMVEKQQFLQPNHIRQISKVFKLQIQNLQKQPIQALSQNLKKSLHNYLISKQTQPVQKQFVRITQAKNFSELCHACLHFYTLEKYSLYQNLNFLLRNVRSIVFREQLEKLKLFGFLLICNFIDVYGSLYDDDNTPPVLYRYTDWVVQPEMVGKIVTVPSFYSLSARDDIVSFKSKQTKIVIHPLPQSNSSISIKSLYPIYKFSAFQKQQQYLYIPFTSFLVTQVRYKKSQQKWYVILKEVPGNPIVKRIIDMNLISPQKQYKKSKSLTSSNQDTQQQFTSQWELKCQQKYEFSKDPLIRIKTSYNLGLIFMRFMVDKLDIASNYFKQGLSLLKDFIQTCNKNNPLISKQTIKKRQISLKSMLVKGYNYLGVALTKMEKLNQAQQAFISAQHIIKQILSYFDENEPKQKQLQSNLNDIAKIETDSPLKQGNKPKKQSSIPKTQINKKQQNNCITENKPMKSILVQQMQPFPQVTDSLLYLIAALKNNECLYLQAKLLYKQAISKYKEALAIVKKCQLKNEAMEACIMNNIGACMTKTDGQNDRKEAFVWFLDSFTHYLNVYGGVIIRNNQQSPTKQSKQQQQQSAQKKIYTMTKNLPKNPKISELVAIFENLSEFLQPTNLNASKFYMEQAIGLYRDLKLVSQHESQTLMYMKSRLAKLLTKAHKYNESIQIYKDVIQIAGMIDETGLKKAMIKSNIASNYVNLGTNQDFKMAVYWYTEAIKDISTPLRSQNLQFYNKICDIRSDIQKYCVNFNEKDILNQGVNEYKKIDNKNK